MSSQSGGGRSGGAGGGTNGNNLANYTSIQTVNATTATSTTPSSNNSAKAFVRNSSNSFCHLCLQSIPASSGNFTVIQKINSIRFCLYKLNG
jgi:hypothetical protein